MTRAPSTACPAPLHDGCFPAARRADGRRREPSCSARWPSSGPVGPSWHTDSRPGRVGRGRAGRHEGPVRKKVDL